MWRLAQCEETEPRARSIGNGDGASVIVKDREVNRGEEEEDEEEEEASSRSFEDESTTRSRPGVLIEVVARLQRWRWVTLVVEGDG